MTRKKKHQQKYDVAIIGGGLSGLTMASMVGQAGINVVCIDGSDPTQTRKDDLRTTAISYGSHLILKEAGIWQKLKQEACPIKSIDIRDGSSPTLLNFDCKDLDKPAFGWIVDNSDLRQVLLDRVLALKTVDHIAPMQVLDLLHEDDVVRIVLKNGKSVQARLIIGADGRESFVRAWMDGPERRWDYHQCAVICNVVHEHPHHGKAVEHFWPDGPFAILPLNDDEEGNHRSAIVFTEHKKAHKASRMTLSDAAFNLALAARCPKEYGSIRISGRRQAWPLNFIHATSYIAPRVALIADAAHGMHPIAGQGLNMGFRDVKALAELLVAAHKKGQDLGQEHILNAYEAARRADNTIMLAATDGLVRLFSNDFPGLKVIRKAGLRLVGSVPPAKRFFSRYAMGL
ncbi:MAG: UbiH/UbiF/VisC/COQ6 family ubiquinone biosynthesis hydroxylase [Alphaproteobacteria bacterium]|nr:UbiH/UbiF/VisC/COQ6 family ubiquinone biosynthesis hydroxylase [Alphaproteobacteria bacterium]